MTFWINTLLVLDSAVEDHIYDPNLFRQVKKDGIILVQGRNVFGEEIYCYLKLDIVMFFEVKRKLNAKEKFDLREYGTIIAAGLGMPAYITRFEFDKNHNLVPFKKITEKS